MVLHFHPLTLLNKLPIGVGLTLMDTRRVTMKGIAFEWARPPFSEAKVVKVDDGGIVLRSDPKRFPLSVERGRLIAVGEGWKNHVPLIEAFDGETLDPVMGVNGMGSASDLGDGTIRVEMGMRKWRAARPLRPGDIALMRSGYRPSPGISLCRAHDTLMEDCTWHGGDGMGLVAQRCENVTLRGSGRASDRTAGAFARKGGGYATALQADATHFSNCKGLVLVENCFFEATVDDAINVHSTCLKIESVPKPDTLVCRYMHRQSTGFEVFLPGERLRFIKAATLEPGAEAVVKDARIIDPRTAVITLAEPVPQGYGPGDAVENADWQPAVVFRNNIARKICARAVLLTTPGKTVIEGNLFDRVSSQVIQLEGDASGWYESGACRDVTIRNNVFRDCAFLRGEGIVQIRPNLKDIKSQKERYHRNIVIERNRFETPRIPLLRACSVSNLVWRDNEVIYNDNFPARGNEPFVIDYSEDVVHDFDARGFLPPGAVQSAEKAIRELGEMNAQYPAEKFLADLRVVEEWKGRNKGKMLDELLQRALVRENPLLTNEIIYTTHAMWRRDHHNTETLFQCGEINEAKYVTHGALRALDPRTGARRDIVPDAPGRTVRDPEVDWDGRRIVFSMRNGRKDDYHIYAVNPDGTGLAQLTRADMDGFVPCAENQAFETRYRKRQECERKSYNAIRTGRKVYDD